MASIWTVELKERVKELWVNHSASQIAGILGRERVSVKRNAVIGIVHRMGLTIADKIETRVKGVKILREKRSSENHHSIIKRIVRSNGTSDAMRVIETREAAESFKLRCVEIVPRGISLLDLEPGDCRYPTNDDAPFLFCGHPKFKGSYCASHYFLTRGEGTASEQAATKISRRHLEVA